jgi:predicted house-cleaning noncanonical NTP pyrophosphatase (MazG superfamily)
MQRAGAYERDTVKQITRQLEIGCAVLKGMEDYLKKLCGALNSVSKGEVPEIGGLKKFDDYWDNPELAAYEDLKKLSDDLKEKLNEKLENYAEEKAEEILGDMIKDVKDSIKAFNNMLSPVTILKELGKLDIRIRYLTELIDRETIVFNEICKRTLNPEYGLCSRFWKLKDGYLDKLVSETEVVEREIKSAEACIKKAENRLTQLKDKIGERDRYL